MAENIEFQSIKMSLGELYCLFQEKQLLVSTPKKPWSDHKTLNKTTEFFRKFPFEDKPLLIFSDHTSGLWSVVRGKNKLRTLFYMLGEYSHLLDTINFRRSLIKIHLINLVESNKAKSTPMGSIKKAYESISSNLN